MERDTLKWLFLVTFLVEAVLAGIIPVYCKAFSESPSILSIANAFSGGVFFAIAIMHIMPEQTEAYADLKKDEKDPYPLPFLLFIVGYTIILIIDKVLFDSHIIFDGSGD